MVDIVFLLFYAIATISLPVTWENLFYCLKEVTRCIYYFKTISSMEIIFYCSESLWLVEFLHEFQDKDEMIYLFYFAFSLIFLTAWMSGLLSKYFHVFITLEVTLLYLCLLNSDDFTMCTGHAVFWRNFYFSQCHVITCFSLSPCSCLLNVDLYHVKSYTDLQKYLNCFVELLEGLQRAFVMPYIFFLY